MEKLEEFFKYFFGQGETVEFKSFSFAHFLPIILMIGIIFLLYKYSKKIRDYNHESWIRLALAFILIITEMSYFWRLVGVPSLNPNPYDHLPITICGWCVIFCSYLVVTKNQTLFDIAYFWLFSGTIFALITPTVITYCGPTRFRYYQFWLEHTLGYISIFYMIFVCKMRPNFKSMIKSFSAFSIMALIAFVANKMLGNGANYLFMAKTEDTASILNLLPTNFVLKVLIMGSIIIVMFILAYLPWFIKDRKAKKININN